MAKGQCTFRARDVCEAVKAVRKAGCDVVRVEVDKDGKIVVITNGKAEELNQPNEWDTAP
jgi:4-hydroxy-3-methylbut-2-en-1-yl diphosphate synthase IspG/GcpE